MQLNRDLHARYGALEDSRLARYSAECIGTFVLVFAYGCNVLSGNWLSGPTSNACVLGVLTYCMGSVSGGHLNPAVSMSLGVCGLMSMGEACFYTLAQFVGGVLGAITYCLVYWESFALGPMKDFKEYPMIDYHWTQAGLAEALYTFMLCFVFLNSAVALRQKGGQFHGVAVGLVIVAGGYSAGAISGGHFNPALAFGIDVTSVHTGFGWSALYIGFELAGAAMAAVLFRLVRPEEFEKRFLPLGHTQQQAWGTTMVVVSEFVGTYLLVVTMGLSVYVQDPINAAWAVAASLSAIVLSLWDVSGAHCNPAVTLAVVLGGGWSLSPRTPRDRAGASNGARSAAYVTTQVAAGIFASFTCTFAHGWGSLPVVHPKYPQATWQLRMIIETLFTFLLCYTVLTTATATTQRPLNHFAGLAVGLSALAGGYVAAAVGGGSLNPAATLGMLWLDNMLSRSGHIGRAITQVLSELMGACLAAALTALVNPAAYFRCAAPSTPVEGNKPMQFPSQP